MDATFTLQVGEKYDYQADMSTIWAGDTISTVAWVFPTGLTKGAESNTTTAATVWVTRTESGTKVVKGTITSTAGRIEVISWMFIE